MKCPYCAERIKAAAIYCKHCHRHLGKTDDLVDRLADLHAAVAALEASIAVLPAEMAEHSQQSDVRPPGWLVVLTMALAASLIAGLANYIWWQVPSGDPSEAVLLAVSIGAAPVAALMLGIHHPVPRWRRMTVIGTIAAVGYSVVEWHHGSGFFLVEAVWLVPFFVLACIMSGAFGGWLGDRSLRREAVTLPTRVHEIVTWGSSPADDGLLRHLADFAKAITPLVTALAPLLLLVLQFIRELGEKQP